MRELSPEFLQEHYIRLGKTRYQISAETGVDPMKIGSMLQQYGIKRYSVKRHGKCNHPLNNIWLGMKERCNNPKSSNYKWYGGKGITVCDEWNSFENFYNWAVNNRWEPGLSIDRIDSEKNYSPDNCRFVTMKEQFRNRSSNCYITINGETKLQVEWAEKIGIKSSKISKWKARRGLEYAINRISEALQ